MKYYTTQICKSAYVLNDLYCKPVIIFYCMTQIKPILFYSKLLIPLNFFYIAKIITFATIYYLITIIFIYEDLKVFIFQFFYLFINLDQHARIP